MWRRAAWRASDRFPLADVMLMTLSLSIVTLLQAAADSAVPRMLVERSWLDTLANVAQSLVSVLLTAMLVVGVLLLYAIKKSIDELSKLVTKGYEPVAAVLKEAREVTSEVRLFTKSLRGPVTMAGETLENMSDGVRTLMERAEERLERLDTLVQVAQEEVEGVVIGAASMLRGVKAGGAALRRSFGLGGPKRKATASARRKRRRSDDGVSDATTRVRGTRDDERPRIRSRPARNP